MEKSFFKKAIILIVMVLLALVTLGNTGCDENEKQVSSSGATQASEFFKFSKNADGNTCEQQNIFDRYKITTNFTKVMWIHLIALDGKIVKRMPVRWKVTSSGKRLEPTHAADGNEYFPDVNSSSSFNTDEFIEADGTYGNSDPYIFWFDPMGRYHQWGTAGGLGYLLTDYPINLENPQDQISGLYNMDKIAHEWQLLQEEKLKEQQNK